MSNPNAVVIEEMDSVKVADLPDLIKRDHQSSNSQELANHQFFPKHTHDGNERSERSDNLPAGPAAHELPKDTYDKFFKICEPQVGANLTAQCDHCAAKVRKVQGDFHEVHTRWGEG